MLRIDKYEVIEEIGRGGMGAVYKSFHPHLKKYIAIKEIRPEIASDPEIKRLFEREAELLANLPSHPNLVTIRDAFLWEGRLFLVMDYLEGGTLGDLIEQGPVDPAQGAKWLDQILSGLAAIHSRGILHRDLKPANILLDRGGDSYITDFGIAESSGQVSEKTAPSEKRLTAKYAAPEVIDPALKRNGGEELVDLYALGMLAYEMLLGGRRFREVFPMIYNTASDGAAAAGWLNWQTDLRQRATPLNSIDPNIPKSLSLVVERLMAKDVNERYQDANEARRDLAAGQRQPAPRAAGMSGSSDDATVPLSQIRPQPPRNNRDDLSQQSPPPPPPIGGSGGRGGRRFRPWVVWTAGAVALLALLIIAPMAMQSDPGFTVTVVGAPPGSDVIVGETHRGIPVIDRPDNGAPVSEIKIYGLKPGEHAMSVACPSGTAELYTLDNQPLRGKVAGRDGDDIRVTAQCGELAEIDYKGRMRLIKAGGFIMGDAQGAPNEQPEHPETLNYDYFMDKFEVTNAAYREFCQATGRKFPDNPWWDPQYAESNSNSPVVGVSWGDAQAYAQWAGKQLPTEAEWEKAATWDPQASAADTDRKWKRRWPWGKTDNGGRANFNTQHPTPVGQETSGASAYGVLDLAGNVAEWTGDFYKAYPGSQAQDTNFGAINRVVRGGTFIAKTADEVRSTRRSFRAPEFSADERQAKSWLIGFRCAVRANDPKLIEHLQRTNALKK